MKPALPVTSQRRGRARSCASTAIRQAGHSRQTSTPRACNRLQVGSALHIGVDAALEQLVEHLIDRPLDEGPMRDRRRRWRRHEGDRPSRRVDAVLMMRLAGEATGS
jgi:hypothetical protein